MARWFPSLPQIAVLVVRGVPVTGLQSCRSISTNTTSTVAFTAVDKPEYTQTFRSTMPADASALVLSLKELQVQLPSPPTERIYTHPSDATYVDRTLITVVVHDAGLPVESANAEFFLLSTWLLAHLPIHVCTVLLIDGCDPVFRQVVEARAQIFRETA
jgi:hypothetical protein